MIDREIEKKVGLVALILAAIWGINLFLFLMGAYNNVRSIDFAFFIIKLITCIIPIGICCLALIPIINEDMKVISYISIGLSAIVLIIFLFTDGIDSNFFNNILIIDFLILLICTVRTSSGIHRIFKYGMFFIVALTVAISNPTNTITESVPSVEGLLLSSSKEPSMAPLYLSIFTILGMLLNPCIAIVTEDDAYTVGPTGGVNNKYDRKESPLEMYNRLVKEQQNAQAAPTAQAGEAALANAAPASPAPAKPTIGPNSGAVINPLAMVNNQAQPAAAPVQTAPAVPTPTSPATGAPAAGQTTNENFEVPESMSFLFDNNEDKSN